MICLHDGREVTPVEFMDLVKEAIRREPKAYAQSITYDEGRPDHEYPSCIAGWMEYLFYGARTAFALGRIHKAVFGFSAAPWLFDPDFGKQYQLRYAYNTNIANPEQRAEVACQAIDEYLRQLGLVPKSQPEIGEQTPGTSART